ncbi:MAG: GNAT family N-acetyltransferase [Bacilli bacterium]
MNNTGIQIRVLAEADLLDCSEVLIMAFKDKPWKEDWTNKEAFERLKIIAGSANSFGLVAIDGKKIIGMALGREMIYCQRNEFWLDEFSLLPSYQHQGIAKKLFSSLKNELSKRNIQKLFLVTRRNYHCQTFYEQEGLTQSKDDVVMGLDLN